MKKSTLGALGLSVALLAAGIVLGQSVSLPTNAPATAPAAAPKQQKLYKVAMLKTADEYQQFQANVQLLQAQRQQAQELNAAMDKETNAAKKKELKAKFDTLVAKLTENNQTMVKMYSFSLERNYTLVIESASVYLNVTDEEAAKLEKAAADAAADVAKKK